MDYARIRQRREGNLSVLATRWQTTMRLPQIKPSPLWLWSLPGDLRGNTPLFFEGMRGQQGSPKVANNVKGQVKANNPCQASKKRHHSSCCH